MRYADLFEEQEPGTYVGARFTSETNEGLQRYQAEHKIPNPLSPEKFHTTIAYSRVPIAWSPREDLAEADDAAVAPKGLTVFESRKDGTRCLVLLLDSDYLQERFDTAIEAGATHDFPSYQPHITLSYDIGTLDHRKLPVPNVDLILSHEYTEPLEENWASK
jgi:2'-5' RNA ligase